MRRGSPDLRNFYPRPPRGGRRKISSVEGKADRFLSTPSARRATTMAAPKHPQREISIHALREEGDLYSRRLINRPNSKFLSTPSARRATSRQTVSSLRTSYFYPRPPRGGRLEGDTDEDALIHFYPRPPRGGRPLHTGRRWRPAYFYPRPPRGGRRGQTSGNTETGLFLSTPSARRATLFLLVKEVNQ